MVGATGIEPVTPTVSRNCNSTKSLEVSVYCLWSSFLCSDFAPRNQLQTIKREKVSPDRLDGWLRLARLIRRPANRRSMTAQFRNWLQGPITGPVIFALWIAVPVGLTYHFIVKGK